MKTRNILYLLTFIFTLVYVSSTAKAQNIEQIYMKNGSVVEGYICEQIPGKTLTVQSSKATIVVSSDSLQNSSEREVKIGDLAMPWQNWATDQTDMVEETIKLTTLQFVNIQYKDVYLVERGALMKFVDLTPKQYRFGWEEMIKTVKMQRPSNQFSGVKDVLVLKNGIRYTGQITEQYPGKNIKILTEDNNIVTVNASQVIQIESLPVSDKLSLLEQAPLLDRIYVKGKSEPIEGFITRRTMGKDLTIVTLDGGSQTADLKSIGKYQKYSNPKYQVLTDKKLADGEVILNGKTAWFAPLQVENQYIILGEEVSAKAIIGDTITLEAKLPNAGSTISLIKAYRKKLPEFDRKAEKIRDVFTYQDLVEKALPYGRSLTPLGNTKIQFKVLSAGDYIISIQGQKGYIVVNVADNSKQQNTTE